jgi:hypothetical protein
LSLSKSCINIDITKLVLKYNHPKIPLNFDPYGTMTLTGGPGPRYKFLVPYQAAGIGQKTIDRNAKDSDLIDIPQELSSIYHRPQKMLMNSLVLQLDRPRWSTERML